MGQLEAHMAGTSAAVDLSFDEASRRFAGEWILFRVTALDERGAIARGEVVAHTESRSRLNRSLERFHSEHPDAEICIVMGGTTYATGDQLRLELAALAGRAR